MVKFMHTPQNSSRHVKIHSKCWLFFLHAPARCPGAAPHARSLARLLYPLLAESLLLGKPSPLPCLGKFLIRHTPAKCHLLSAASFLRFPGKGGFMAPLSLLCAGATHTSVTALGTLRYVSMSPSLPWHGARPEE